MIPFNYVQKKEGSHNGERGRRGNFEVPGFASAHNKGKDVMEKRGAVRLHTMP